MSPLFDSACFARLDALLRGLGSGWRVEELHGAGPAGSPPVVCAHRPAASPEGPRILVSAGIHGDEPAGPIAILEHLSQSAFADSFEWVLFPALNPAGLLRGTRDNASGIDLNRDFLLRRAPETRFFVEQVGRFPGFDLHLSLHEDWEYDKAYLYELNSSGHASIAAELLRVTDQCIGLVDADEIDGHIPTARGFIRHALEPDEPEGWPEAIFLTHKFPLLSYTLETPSRAALSARVHCFRNFLEVACTTRHGNPGNDHSFEI